MLVWTAFKILAQSRKDRKEQKEKLSGFAPLREITFSSTYVI